MPGRSECRSSVEGNKELAERQAFGHNSVTRSFHPTMPPQKVVSTPYRLIDADPHATRVVSYMRPSDYAVWGGSTAAAPAALYLWGEHLEITRSTDRKTDGRVMCY